jgi:hypothetical protein
MRALAAACHHEGIDRPGVSTGRSLRLPAGRWPGRLIGLLRARCALVFNTSNTPWGRELAAFGNPLERLWKDC